MDFGICLYPLPGWYELFKVAEEAGFDHIWVAGDHKYADTFTSMTYGVMTTKRIRFSPYSNSVFLRHPVLMASGIAMIDEIAPGRVATEYCSAGYETSVRLHIPDEDAEQAVREAVEITRQLWTGDVVNYTGTHWQLTNVQLCHQTRPEIPIFIATRGGKFRLVGEVADGAIIHGKAPEFLELMATHFKEGAKRVHRPLPDINVAVSLPFLFAEGTKREPVRDSMKTLLAAYTGGEYSMEFINSLGLTEEDVLPLRQELRKHGREVDVRPLISQQLRDKLIYALAVAGDVEEGMDAIEEMRKHHVTQVAPIIHPSFFSTLSDMRAYLLRFSEQFIQPFQEDK